MPSESPQATVAFTAIKEALAAPATPTPCDPRTEDFKKLRSAFDAARTVICGEHQINEEFNRRLQVLIDEYFNAPGAFTSITSAKAHPRYDEGQYPSLFRALRVLGDWDNTDIKLPDEWTAEALSNAIEERKNDPLVRLLLAFIWKQGDLHTLKPLLAGLREEPLGTRTTGAVMWQFGRHLRSPLTEPIFDQHTSRALALIEQLDQWKSLHDFRNLFGRHGIPKDASLTTFERLNEYVRWWNGTIGPRLRQCNNLDVRKNAVLLVDRLMFSLGKAAKGIRAPGVS